MKTEDEILKEIFRNNLHQDSDAPDFEFMWRKAGEGNRKKSNWTWRVAASIALIAAVSTLAILHRREARNESITKITSWTEPTRILASSQTDMQVPAIARWSSPTRSLLPENEHPKK